jgi:SAM-dependent methyltransferase
LEVGCSSGFLLRSLRRDFPEAQVIGADIIDAPLKRLAQKMRTEGIPTPLLRFDLVSCPLANETFDLVAAINVLEHINDHARAAAEIYRILKPGGAFVFEVPSGPSLYDDYDRELHHYRRYEAEALDKLLVKTGFTRKRMSHLGVFIYPAFYAIKKWRARNRPEQNQAKGGDQPSNLSRNLISASSGFLFSFLFALELKLGEYINWPFGIRCAGVYIK